MKHKIRLEILDEFGAPINNDHIDVTIEAKIIPVRQDILDHKYIVNQEIFYTALVNAVDLLLRRNTTSTNTHPGTRRFKLVMEDDHPSHLPF